MSDRLQFIQQMIVKLRTFLLSSDPVRSITVDGISASYDHEGARKYLQELEREERNLLNPKGYRKHIDLRNAFGA